MKKLLWPLALAWGLAGCASLQDIGNVITGNSSQKVTRTPIWLYRPDLQITVDGVTFHGMGVTTLSDETMLEIDSQVDIDRVEMATCSRHDVCQIKGGSLACDQRTSKNPNGKFQVDKDWFGNAGKSMSYYFSPDRKERDDSCANMDIAIYSKNSLASWGYIDFRDRPERNFPAHFTCNAKDWLFQGVSVCAAKAGTIQEINFDQPVEDWRADDSCNMKKISDKEFEFQPRVGWCRASFMQNLKFHDVVINGYDEVLIRDGK